MQMVAYRQADLVDQTRECFHIDRSQQEARQITKWQIQRHATVQRQLLSSACMKAHQT